MYLFCIAENMETLTYVTPAPAPSWCTRACVRSHTLAFVHAHRLTHTWNIIFFFPRHIPNCELPVTRVTSSEPAFCFTGSKPTYSSDTFFLCSRRDRSTRCSSYTDLRSYTEDCTQLKQTTRLNCGGFKKNWQYPLIIFGILISNSTRIPFLT